MTQRKERIKRFLIIILCCCRMTTSAVSVGTEVVEIYYKGRALDKNSMDHVEDYIAEASAADSQLRPTAVYSQPHTTKCSHH